MTSMSLSFARPLWRGCHRHCALLTRAMALQGFSNGMPEQPDMHLTIFNLAVMHGSTTTYSAMQKLYLEARFWITTLHWRMLHAQSRLCHTSLKQLLIALEAGIRRLPDMSQLNAQLLAS